MKNIMVHKKMILLSMLASVCIWMAMIFIIYGVESFLIFGVCFSILTTLVLIKWTNRKVNRLIWSLSDQLRTQSQDFENYKNDFLEKNSQLENGSSYLSNQMESFQSQMQLLRSEVESVNNLNVRNFVDVSKIRVQLEGKSDDDLRLMQKKLIELQDSIAGLSDLISEKKISNLQHNRRRDPEVKMGGVS